MASGITVESKCGDEFKLLKMHKRYHFIIFKLSTDMKTVVVDHCEPKNDGDHFPDVYKHLLSKLKEVADKKSCCYVVLDAVYKKVDTEKTKIMFIYYGPDSSNVKHKMTYSSTKDAVIKALGQGSIHLQLGANDDGDIEWKEIEKKLLEKDNY